MIKIYKILKNQNVSSFNGSYKLLKIKFRLDNECNLKDQNRHSRNVITLLHFMFDASKDFSYIYNMTNPCFDAFDFQRATN